MAGENGVGETTEEEQKLWVDVDFMRGKSFEFAYPEGLTVEYDRFVHKTC